LLAYLLPQDFEQELDSFLVHSDFLSVFSVSDFSVLSSFASALGSSSTTVTTSLLISIDE